MKQSKKQAIITIISLILFIFILFEILSNGFLVSLDAKINSATTSKNSFLVDLSKIIAIIFDAYAIIALSIILTLFFYFKLSKKDSLFFISTIIVNAAIFSLIKAIIQRPRPLNSLVAEVNSAFPSGHVTNSFVFFGLLTYLAFKSKKSGSTKKIILLISSFFVILIALTRLYLRVHWLSDVLGGLALGSFILFSGILLNDKIR